MALLTVTAITSAGQTVTPASVTASDTISGDQMGPNGCIHEVITVGTGCNVSISDPGSTSMGNAGTVTPVAVGTNTRKKFFIPRSAINPATGVATVAYSATTAITSETYRY